MGKRVFFLMIVAIVGGLTWFVVDVGLAETKASTEPHDTQSATFSHSNAEPMCASDGGSHSPDCQAMEQRILATTLRIEVRTWIIYVEGKGYQRLSSVGHGTVLAGRYLLTHNHFGLPLLELLSDDWDGEFATVTLYTAQGELLWQGPLTTAAVAFDDSETLLLEFRDREGRGLFDSLGLPSADFAAGGAEQIAVGSEVAQINWDEHQAHVQWTKVRAAENEGDTPVIRLASCPIHGASGGGVFLDGAHIANNWSSSRACFETGRDDAQLFSIAALNSAELLAAGS